MLSEELQANVHYYFSNRFFAAGYGSFVFNRLNGAGERLWEQEQLFPDISCVKYRADLTVGYHLFYGKFRLTMDSVFYFDQYLALGAGLVSLTNGIVDKTEFGLVADIGFVFWFGRRWSSRLGVKDHYFKELRRLGRDNVHHLLGHLSLGYLL